MLRLFVGIALPPGQRLALSALCTGLPGARWVDPGNFHVTLRFIGEVDEGLAADIHDRLTAIRSPPFELSIVGLGAFGGKSHTLFATVERSTALLRLHDRIENTLARLGLAPDTRRFSPHVTLARVQGVAAELLGRFIAANNLFRLPPVAVDRFELVASHLSKGGSIYEDLAEYRLH